MERNLNNLYGKIISLGAVIFLAGCVSNVATVTYSQIGACVGYTNNIGDLVGVGPNAADIIFRIENIDNTGSKVDFHFNPALLYTVVGQQFAVDLNGQLNTVLQGNQLTAEPAVTVPAGKAQSQWGYIAIEGVPTQNANGLIEGLSTSYPLNYHTPSTGPGVLLANSHLGQTHAILPTNYKGDCIALVNAQPTPN
jgi:hypothetical protein